MATPRLLVIMGSGETAPTMAKVHRMVFDRLGPGDVPAAILDTPYGFQENADDLSERTVRFFAEHLGRSVEVASYRSRDADPLASATAVSILRRVMFVMAGPGSPSYALRQWADGPIASALSHRIEMGGSLTMASAAALTLGALTIPVYEIYKVGEAPHWLKGLDLLAPATGLRAAVVPHFDNAEGGNHDTRFCYIGERRLAQLEGEMPEDTFILGVDSHTAVVLDLDRHVASVAGRGGMTVRARGQSTVFPSGSEVGIETISEVAAQLAAGDAVTIGWESPPTGPGARSLHAAGPAGTDGASEPVVPAPHEPLSLAVDDLEGTFVDALGRGDRRAAVAALLDLDMELDRRTAGGEESQDLDNAKSTFRALIARLGGTASPADLVAGPSIDHLVEVLLQERGRARESGAWATADAIRAALRSAGIEIRDGADASSRVESGR